MPARAHATFLIPTLPLHSSCPFFPLLADARVPLSPSLGRPSVDPTVPLSPSLLCHSDPKSLSW
jgi:hypothetical protein